MNIFRTLCCWHVLPLSLRYKISPTSGIRTNDHQFAVLLKHTYTTTLCFFKHYFSHYYKWQIKQCFLTFDRMNTILYKNCTCKQRRRYQVNYFFFNCCQLKVDNQLMSQFCSIKYMLYNEPDVIRTRSLLIWSQTRYRCATSSAQNSSNLQLFYQHY